MQPAEGRNKGRWPARLAGLAVLAALFAAPLLPSMRLDQMPVMLVAQDVMHVPLAVAVALVLYRLLGEGARRLVAALALAALGLALLEVAQGVLATGQPSWGDLLLDGLGLAWVAAAHGLRGRLSSRRRAAALALLAVALLAVPVGRVIAVARSEQARMGRMPVLADFEHDGDLLPWRGTGGMTIAAVGDPDGGRVLRCDFVPGERPAVLFTYPPEDWSGYGRLRLRARSLDGRRVALTLKVTDLVNWRDFDHRHTRPLVFGPSWSEITVDLDSLITPSGRIIDRSRINTVVVFIRGAERSGAFAMDDLRLEP